MARRQPRLGRVRMGSLFAWRSGARGEFEVKDARSAPPPAATPQAVVLEFKFPSRIIASKQSMTDRRRARRAARGERESGNMHVSP